MLLGNIFLFIVCIPLLLLLVYFIDKSVAKPQNNIILGATVLPSKLQDKELLEIVEEYKKDEKKFILIGLITAVPILFVSIKFDSLAVIYLILWTVFVMIYEDKCLKKAFNKVQHLKKKNGWFIIVDGKICEDDDKYWHGLFYNNPKDKRFMVDKRVGIGTTINFAHPGGKIFIAVTAIILTAVLIPVSIICFKLHNADFNLSLKDNKVIIESPMYSIDFKKDDILDVSIVSGLPKASRTNGAEDSKIALGNYNVHGYGKSKVYIKRNVDKIVVIKLKDEYIFISGDSEKESQKYYDKLIRK